MTMACADRPRVRVLNYGGGTNSTALAIESLNRGIALDAIVFADTGSERPETYAYLETFGAWLRAHGLPDLLVTRWVRVKGDDAGRFVPLHEWCERSDQVPSRAFGLSGCTSKWKQQPADKAIRDLAAVRDAHARGERVERWIGFDADEPGRAARMLSKDPDAALWAWRAPLVEWDMGRDGCVSTIERAGLPLPGKSACWMCPSTKKREIDQLAADHPDLLERSLRMERNAIAAGNLTSRKGLGGSLNWGTYVEAQRRQLPIVMPDAPDDACGCYDGDA